MRSISAHDLLEQDALRDALVRCKDAGCILTAWRAGYCRRHVVGVIAARREDLAAIAEARDAVPDPPPEEDTMVVYEYESLTMLREVVVERGCLPTGGDVGGLRDRLKADFGSWGDAVERLGFPRPHRGTRSPEELDAIEARVAELRDEAGWTMPPPPAAEDRPRIDVDLPAEDGWPEGAAGPFPARPPGLILPPDSPLEDLEFEAADQAHAAGRDAEVAAAEAWLARSRWVGARAEARLAALKYVLVLEGQGLTDRAALVLAHINADREGEDALP